MGEANLPVCRIFRRGIDVYSSSLPRSDEIEFVQFPLQVPHAAKQFIPCFLHEHLREPQTDLQLHLTTHELLVGQCLQVESSIH